MFGCHSIIHQRNVGGEKKRNVKKNERKERKTAISSERTKRAVVLVESIFLSFYSSTVPVVILIFFLLVLSLWFICAGNFYVTLSYPSWWYWDESARRPSVAFTAAYIMASTTHTLFGRSLSYCIILSNIHRHTYCDGRKRKKSKKTTVVYV